VSMKENKMKVVIPVYNAEKWIQKCIWSLYNQSYQNWEAVIVNDASTDKTLDVIKDFMKDIPAEEVHKKKRFRVLDRTMNVGALENIDYGTELLCDDDEDVVVLLDGDDWLAANDVLTHLNELYQDETWLTYGQFQFNSNGNISSNRQITDTRTYRTKQSFCSSHLRTYKYKIWKRIKKDDLKNGAGKYYPMAWDLSIMYPLIEMAGPKRIKCADKVMYIYNNQNPINDHKKNYKLQVSLDFEIRKKPQYAELP